MKTLRCIVPAFNSNGEPDLYFVKVRTTDLAIKNGDHYEAAAFAAGFNGYDVPRPAIVFDEYDTAGRQLLSLFEWGTASIVGIDGKELTP